ncbi:MAG: aspartate kinase [Bacillota bacterium]|nr:aspartate kinase [Bacillota bacterium]
MKVCKFGGTSLASAEQIKKVCEIVTSDSDRQLVVVSAPGKRSKDDIKVTDLLISCAEKYIKTGAAVDEMKAVVARFDDIARELGLDGTITEVIAADIKSRLSGPVTHEGKLMDSLKAAGEDNSAKLFAAYLKSKGFEAQYINPKDAGLFLSDEFGNARVLSESFENLKSLNDIPGIKIFPGFFGYSKHGDVVTFPRGGSDITGSIIAAAIGAEVYENFTDVDSVFAANPNIVPGAKAIKEFSYREMRELSYAGFSVLHEETLEPVYRKGIPVCIKNTNNPKARGTMIVKERTSDNGIIAGIAGDIGFSILYISKYMMNREVGFGRKVLQILEEQGLSYEHVPSGIDNMSVVLRSKELSDEKEKNVINRIRQELVVDDIEIVPNLALVMVVGEGMRHTVGLSARATNALSKEKVNIEMINQGSSEVSMMFGVRASDCETAIKALYKEFFS